MKFGSDAFGAKILETITWGLYDGNLNCLREYVQNGIDSGEKGDLQCQNINIYFENKGNDLIIRDDGPGMNESELTEALKVGISRKGKNKIGWRGIGIWSGVPVSRNIVILTKKKGGEKLRIRIDNIKLRTESEKSRLAYEVLTEITSEITKEQVSKNESEEHYTEIRLESILPTQRRIFSSKAIKEYLIRNVPASFNKEKFKFASVINRELAKNGVEYPNVKIRFNNKEIYRPPDADTIFIENIIFKQFEINGEKVATGWFLTTDQNRTLKKDLDNSGIFFKKKGFTIGDENTVVDLYQKTYHAWQNGEIHIISDKIRENSSRSNFEYLEDNLVIDFFDEIKEFIGELIKLNHYQSEKSILKKHVDDLREKIERGDIRGARDKLIIYRERLKRKKKFPEDESLQQHKKIIDKITDKNVIEITLLEQLFMKKKKQFETKAGIDKILDRIDDCPYALKKDLKKLCINGKLEPEMNITGEIVKLLKNKTGLNDNELVELSRKAYGWNKVTDHESKNILTITKGKNIWRDKFLGVMIYAIHELFVNAAKHDKGKPEFEWFEKLNYEERCEILAGVVSTISLFYRLIDKSTKREIN